MENSLYRLTGNEKNAWLKILNGKCLMRKIVIALAAGILFPAGPAIANFYGPIDQCQHLAMWLSPQEKNTIENEIKSGHADETKIREIWRNSVARHQACLDQATAQIKIQGAAL